jgi:hypothetical protein
MLSSLGGGGGTTATATAIGHVDVVGVSGATVPKGSTAAVATIDHLAHGRDARSSPGYYGGGGGGGGGRPFWNRGAGDADNDYDRPASTRDDETLKNGRQQWQRCPLGRPKWGTARQLRRRRTRQSDRPRYRWPDRVRTTPRCIDRRSSGGQASAHIRACPTPPSPAAADNPSGEKQQ